MQARLIRYIVSGPLWTIILLLQLIEAVWDMDISVTQAILFPYYYRL